MSSRTRIQPIPIGAFPEESPIRQAPRSRLRWIFDSQYSLKDLSGVDMSLSLSDSEGFEPSSFCLRRMVENYIEDPNSGKQKCGGRSPCNCFSGDENYFSGCDSDSDSSDEEESFSNRVLAKVKSLILCADIAVREKVLVTRTAEIVKKKKIMCTLDNDSRLETLARELVALGYDAAICKTRWERMKKGFVVPAGDYKYLDVFIGGERVLIDTDFKSNFQIARPTETYTSISQTLPDVFVGQVDRLKKVVVVVSKAAHKSLKKNGLSVAPWRKAEYMLTKWLTPHVRRRPNQTR